MSLSGNLGFVSLDEVLRLLTRSQQQGSVEVSGEEVRGRIFVTKGGVALATTADDASLRHHLIKSGLVDEIYMQRVESGDASFAPVAEETGGALVDLLREMTVESLYQMGLKGDAFEVREGQETRFGSPEAFELEHLLEQSRQRLTEWTDVSRTVSDLEAALAFRPSLGDREDVKIDRDGWRLLSQVGSGSSVASLADRLGTTEFWTARTAAGLIGKELLEFVSSEPETQPEAETAEWDNAWNESADSGDSADSADPNESWWEEPAIGDSDHADSPDEEPAIAFEAQTEEQYAAEDHPAEEKTFAVAESNEESGAFEGFGTTDDADEPESMIPSLGEVSASDTADVEEDTEAFLEKVFSELDDSSEEKEDQEEGYGLLRRRRMGAIRDIAGDA